MCRGRWWCRDSTGPPPPSSGGFERAEYHENIASAIRIGPRQNQALHELLREACAVLDIAEPELFVRHGTFNAYTSGHNHPYIVLFTELLDAMEPDELFSVVAHEVGHVKCGQTGPRCSSSRTPTRAGA